MRKVSKNLPSSPKLSTTVVAKGGSLHAHGSHSTASGAMTFHCPQCLVMSERSEIFPLLRWRFFCLYFILHVWKRDGLSATKVTVTTGYYSIVYGPHLVHNAHAHQSSRNESDSNLQYHNFSSREVICSAVIYIFLPMNILNWTPVSEKSLPSNILNQTPVWEKDSSHICIISSRTAWYWIEKATKTEQMLSEN